MAAKKREIYARAAVQLRTHERAIRAETICPGAMGLYFFLLLDSRGEQSHGDVAELVAMCSWGAPQSFRKKQAEALIKVGLVERRDDRLHVVKYDEHNDTPVDIAESRKAARNRQRSRRGHGDVTRDTRVSHADVPISISISDSSDLVSADPDQPVKSSMRAREAPPDEPPAWFGAALLTIEMQTGEQLRPADSWLRYSGHRANKGMPQNQQDAVYWLTTVMVPEARKERLDASARREREAKWDRERVVPRLVEVAKAPYHAEYRPPKDDDQAPPEVARAGLQGLMGVLG